MKYTTILLGLATIMASVTAAAAKADKASCIREQSKTFGVAAAKRICDPKTSVKRNQLGWHCELRGTEPKFYKAEGGARLKRDAVCE